MTGSWNVRTAYATMIVALLASPTALGQSNEPLPEGGGRAPTAVPVPYDVPRTASPSRPAFTDSAGFIEEGWLELEFGWSNAFAERDLQVGSVLAKYAPTSSMELRLGWDIFGVLEGVEGSAISAQDAQAGVGDLYVEGKFGIPLDIAEPEMHRLSVLGTIRPGIGQVPVTVDGLDLGAFAVYSTYPGPVEVDVQAGVVVRGLFETEHLDLPISSAVTWRALTWLSATGEVVERLTFEDLNASQTSLLLGALFHASDAVVFDASVGLGLSEALPDAVLQLGLTWLATPMSGPDRR